VALLAQGGEPEQVDLVGAGLEDVSRAVGPQPGLSQRPEGLPQPLDVVLHGDAGRERGPALPEQLGQLIGGDDLPGVRDQRREQGPLLAVRDRQQATV
jgi:hypothetical protein